MTLRIAKGSVNCEILEVLTASPVYPYKLLIMHWLGVTKDFYLENGPRGRCLSNSVRFRPI